MIDASEMAQFVVTLERHLHNFITEFLRGYDKIM